MYTVECTMYIVQLQRVMWYRFMYGSATDVVTVRNEIMKYRQAKPDKEPIENGRAQKSKVEKCVKLTLARIPNSCFNGPYQYM